MAFPAHVFPSEAHSNIRPFPLCSDVFLLKISPSLSPWDAIPFVKMPMSRSSVLTMVRSAQATSGRLEHHTQPTTSHQTTWKRGHASRGSVGEKIQVIPGFKTGSGEFYRQLFSLLFFFLPNPSMSRCCSYFYGPHDRNFGEHEKGREKSNTPCIGSRRSHSFKTMLFSYHLAMFEADKHLTQPS
jgi:hypothetical protein